MTVPAAFEFYPGTAPLLISMPHSGTYVPSDLLARFTESARQVPDTGGLVGEFLDLGPGRSVEPHGLESMRKARRMQVRFWGVRGTVPCPGPDTLRYGGNTACVEVMCGDQRLILDAGTGLRALGASLNDQQGLKAHIFLTHTHIDHINGFPFFRPAYRADNCF